MEHAAVHSISHLAPLTTYNIQRCFRDDWVNIHHVLSVGTQFIQFAYEHVGVLGENITEILQHGEMKCGGE